MWLLSATLARASRHYGQVLFNGLPVPGATVTATQGKKKVVTLSDVQGRYIFPDLADGAWKIDVKMLCFTEASQNITVTAGLPGLQWDLKMLPLDQILAQTRLVKPQPVTAPAETASAAAKPQAPKPGEAEMPKPAEDSQANDGFLVNGSVNNAATSQFSLAQGFGNTRKGSRSLYTGGLGLIFGNSALDARPYSLSGLDTPKSAYNDVTVVASFGGPLKIPHLMPRGPNLFVVYEWTRNNIAISQTGLVPTLDQRNGILPGGDVTSISPQAQSLLALYPLPNLAGNASYNYQVPILNSSHQDALQTRLDKEIGRRDQLYGRFAFQSTRANTANLFGFTDTTDTLGLNAKVNWEHRLNRGLYLNTGYSFSRLRTLATPYFANRANVSGAAGITGNDQDPQYWGPPTLVFSSGIASLTDGESAFDRNRTEEVSPRLDWYRGRHNVTVGGDFRRQEFNYLSQQNPRGAFTFTGAATGNNGDFADLADFLTGVPDTSALAYGNADKYLRQSVYDVYATDDWRLRPELTLNIGIRWEYGAPITELKNRLVNLDVTPDFTAVAPVLASDPTGILTGQHYPHSLLRPDKHLVEPRLGLSWRPIAGSSLVVRAGYGLYSDTSVYQATALQLAQQAPLSTSLSVQNSAACPLTLASGFNPCDITTADTFAVDPNFRVGYAQTWQVALQRDLPAAMQLTVTYLGVKGAHGVQEFLPNTYPLGASNPCPLCPVGFIYRTSNGSSTHEAGSVQLRRRLRSGFTATLSYTFAKSIDDDSVLGGQGPVASGTAAAGTAAPAIAQNWLDLRAERSRSSFDQRHLLTTNVQYTTGMGIGGGTLLSGWRGHALKEWTVLAQITAGSGLPETPVYLAAVNGTGFTGPLRPDRTSASLYAAPAGRFINPNAFAAPQPGQWGDAGRNSIEGPGTLSFDASLARTFRLDQRFNLDIRADATNVLNHAVFAAYNTTLTPTRADELPSVLNNPLFGLPVSTNPMRSLQITARLRF